MPIVVAPSNIRILGLNPTRDVQVCLVLSVPVLFCGRTDVRSLESAQFLALVNAALNFLFHEEPLNFGSWTNVIDQKLSYMPLNVVSEHFQPCTSIAHFNLVGAERKSHSPRLHKVHFQQQYQSGRISLFREAANPLVYCI